MTAMSNNQWNSGQGDGQWQQQQGASDWNATPQQSASEVNQDGSAAAAQDWNAAPSNQEWDAGQQGQNWNAGAQPQSSASDWNAGAQPQPSAGDWNQQPGWGAQAQQGWDPNQQAGASAYGQQQWQQQQAPRSSSGFANVFDFSFKKFALPEAAGTIFLIAVIAIAVNWVFNLVAVLTSNYVDASSVLKVILGGLATALLMVLLVRVVIEGMSALVSRNKSD